MSENSSNTFEPIVPVAAVEQVADQSLAIGSTSQRYQRRPAVVTAIQWTGDNLQAVQQFCLPQSPMTHGEQDLAVQVVDRFSMKKYPNLGRQLKMEFVSRGNWLVVGWDDGELGVVGAEEFATEYHPVAAEPQALAAGESDPRD
jgi:hypothetical protein